MSFGQIQGFVAEEVGRECTCAHPGEGEPTGGELDIALESVLESALESACWLGFLMSFSPEQKLELLTH